VIREEGPGGDGEGSRLGEGGQTGNEIFPVRVLSEEDAPSQASHPHLVQGVRGIQAGVARHDGPEATTTCTTWPYYSCQRTPMTQEQPHREW
jgi:hypothetical protein